MKIIQNKSITFLNPFEYGGIKFFLKNVYPCFFFFLSPLFGDTNPCFALSCPAIENKKHDMKKQQQKNNLRLELNFFHKLMVIYTTTTVGWSGNHGE